MTFKILSDRFIAWWRVLYLILRFSVLLIFLQLGWLFIRVIVFRFVNRHFRSFHPWIDKLNLVILIVAQVNWLFLLSFLVDDFDSLWLFIRNFCDSGNRDRSLNGLRFVCDLNFLLYDWTFWFLLIYFNLFSNFLFNDLHNFIDFTRFLNFWL